MKIYAHKKFATSPSHTIIRANEKLFGGWNSRSGGEKLTPDRSGGRLWRLLRAVGYPPPFFLQLQLNKS